MCRTGGRRCPSHADPVTIAKRNKTRREQYASSHSLKNVAVQPEPKAEDIFVPLSDEEYGFVDFSVKRGGYQMHTPEALQFIADGEAYSKAIDAVNPPKRREGFTESFQAVLRFYSESGYTAIRDELNGTRNGLHDDDQTKPDYYEEADRQWILKAVDKLDEAFTKVTPPAEPRMVYRGMNVPLRIPANEVKQWVRDNFKAGAVLSQKNYMSTSMNPRIATEDFSAYDQDEANRGVVFEILSKKGIPMGEDTSIMGLKELEVLMPRETRFRIVSVTEDVDYTNRRKNPVRTVIRLIDMDE